MALARPPRSYENGTPTERIFTPAFILGNSVNSPGPLVLGLARSAATVTAASRQIGAYRKGRGRGPGLWARPGEANLAALAARAPYQWISGFLGYDKIRELSQDVRHRMAGYVRTAILEMCDLDGPVLNRLTSDPFDKPLGHWPIVKYLRGKLRGSGEELAAPGNAYSFIKWNSTIKTVTWEGDNLNVEIDENLTAEIAQGISFQSQSAEAWQAD